MLLDEYHGKGIITEATRQVCTITFAQLDIERITDNVFSQNIASQKVLLKNGFELESVVINALYKNGIVSNLHIYGKCKTR